MLVNPILCGYLLALVAAFLLVGVCPSAGGDDAGVYAGLLGLRAQIAPAGRRSDRADLSEWH